MIRTADALPLFQDRALRLKFIRHLVRYLGSRTLWFGVADNHMHVVFQANPAELGLVSRDLVGILRRLAGGRPLLAPYPKAIESRQHLIRCWPYVVANLEKHGVAGEALADDGSGLADIVGARILPGFDPDTWKRYLPRRSLAEHLSDLRLPPSAAQPAPLERVRELGALSLARAAASSVGWAALDSDRPAVVAARAAVVRVALDAGIAAAEVRHALGIARQSLLRLRKRAVEPVWTDLLLRRISFDAAVRSRAGGVREHPVTPARSHG